MHVIPNLGAKMSALSSTYSPFPASFNNSPWLYGMSLTSLMSITMFSAVVGIWMVRDLWRDRYHDHPTSLIFIYRLIFAVISGTAFLRCLPDVVYMTCYGEVTGAWMGRILSAKRLADFIAMPMVIWWMAMFVLIYPFVMLALRDKSLRLTLRVDPFSVWPRLARPAAVFCVILAIAVLMALAKGSLGHRP